jgi:hypothetical protein
MSCPTPLEDELGELERLLIEAAAKLKDIRAKLRTKEEKPTDKQVAYAMYLAGRLNRKVTEQELRGKSKSDLSLMIDEMLELIRGQERK